MVTLGLIVQFHRFCLYSKDSPPRHSIPGIGGKVEEYLVDLRCIGHDNDVIGSKDSMYGNILYDKSFQKLFCLPYDVVYVKGA